MAIQICGTISTVLGSTTLGDNVPKFFENAPGAGYVPEILAEFGRRSSLAQNTNYSQRAFYGSLRSCGLRVWK
jgi:hypothetical protein